MPFFGVQGDKDTHAPYTHIHGGEKRDVIVIERRGKPNALLKPYEKCPGLMKLKVTNLIM
jgi:hypothetical protein